MLLQLLDFLLTIFHLLVIGFNLLGWIWPATRKWHFIGVLATAFSWSVLGLWFGLGYCPITDWQWQVKTKLGEQDLPNSYIKYWADKVSNQDINAGLVDFITAASFALAAVFSVYFNFIRSKKRRAIYK